MARPANHGALVAIDGALALIAILLIVQMWLLSATLEAFLAGRRAVALPAALVSIGLSGACVALGAFVRKIGRPRGGHGA
jgi:hypothetical protein